MALTQAVEQRQFNFKNAATWSVPLAAILGFGIPAIGVVEGILLNQQTITNLFMTIAIVLGSSTVFKSSGIK